MTPPELKSPAQEEAELAEIRSWIGDLFQWPFSQTMFAPWSMLQRRSHSTRTNRWGDIDELVVFKQVHLAGGEVMLFLELVRAKRPELEALRSFIVDLSGHQGVWLAWFLWNEQKVCFPVILRSVGKASSIFENLRNLTSGSHQF